MAGGGVFEAWAASSGKSCAVASMCAWAKNKLSTVITEANSFQISDGMKRSLGITIARTECSPGDAENSEHAFNTELQTDLQIDSKLIGN